MKIKVFKRRIAKINDIVPVDTKLLEFENKLDMQGIMINILKYEKDISDIER